MDFVAVCVINETVASDRLCSEAPFPLAMAVASHRAGITHLHIAPENASSLPSGEQLAAVTEMLCRNEAAFRTYRKLTPFHVAGDWWFEDELDLTLSNQLLGVLGRLRAAIDFDLYGGNDEYCEKVDPFLPFFHGETFIHVDGELWQSGIDGRRELGRFISPFLRDAEPTREIAFNVLGGAGNPYVHFSANAARLAAASGANIRLRAQPRLSSRAPTVDSADVGLRSAEK